MRRNAFVIVLAGTVCVGSTASALAPSRHRSISEKACRDADLPRDFCRRVGVEAYVTDANEWDDMAAHAQTSDGQSACDGANGASSRVFSLGAEVRAGIDELAHGGTGEAAAVALGRALHTVQDNCAHHGIPNPQHAWYSLDDFCNGADSSPDIQPEAIACARAQTDVVFDDVRDALDAAGASAAALARDTCPDPFDEYSGNDNPCDSVWLPTPWDACGFLGSADEWDGIDRRWNNDLVRPALTAALRVGLLGSGTPADVCQGDTLAIAASDASQAVDVSAGPRSCAMAHLMCFGKADDVSTLFDEPDDLDLDNSGGCSIDGRGPRGGLSFLVMVALAAFVTCRRLRRSPSVR